MTPLPKLRAQIEKIDAEIVRQLNERTRVSVEVGRFKRQHRLPAFAPGREETLLRRLTELNKTQRGSLPAADLRAIYREIFSSSRAQQEALAIGIVEEKAFPNAALHAAWLRFGARETYQIFPNFKSVLHAVHTGKIAIAVCSVTLFAHAFAKLKLPLKFHVCGKIGLNEKGTPSFYLLSKFPADPVFAPLERRLFHATVSSKAKPAFSRWCRTHRITPVALDARKTHFLFETSGTVTPPQTELTLLGIFPASPNP